MSPLIMSFTNEIGNYLLAFLFNVTLEIKKTLKQDIYSMIVPIKVIHWQRNSWINI